jgi:thiamine biosynthesis lipoprotein
MYALGSPPGAEGWIVNVPRPGDRTQRLSTVVLRDSSLSTSGNYEKFFRLGGRMYGHIMDPRTGDPVQGILQTTVIAGDATSTDVLSTAIFVLGPDAGQKLLRIVPGASGLWVLGEPDSPQIVAWHWPDSNPAAAPSATGRTRGH